MYITADTPLVPVYTNLLGLCGGGDKETRSAEGTLSRNKKDIALPPVGRVGVRSSTMRLPLDIHRHRSGGEKGKAILNIYPKAETLSDGEYYSAGIHPWQLEQLMKEPDSEKAVERELEETDRLLQQPNVLALGEVGMDKNISVPPEVQTEVLKRQLKMAEKYRKPVIFHLVKFTDELIRLKKELSPSTEWIIHGFRGKPEMARQLAAQGFGLSFGERYNLLALQATPAGKIFIETDESEVAIEELYRRAADCYGMPGEEFTRQIEKNIQRSFFSNKSCNFL